jgi:glycosyltransferase involved in cell wall biosynthesis
VGRVSQEKNIEAFCELALEKMIVVGDGPARKSLEKKYKHVEFVGVKRGKELAQYYSNADCFVFPSKADTFGVVLLESISCGTPIATYPVSGPKSVVEEGINGYTDDDLYNAVLNSIALDKEPVYNSSEKYTWENCKKIFLDNLIPTI